MTAADAHVVVVGGGIAGLAAALHLSEAGAGRVGVTIVDAGDRFGGKLLTSAFAGRTVDEGADAFLTRVPEALALCPADADLVHPAARTAYLWGRGALRPMPPQLMGVPTDPDALAATGLLSEAGLAAVRADLAREGTTPSPLGPDRPIAEVLSQRIGPEAMQRLVEPLIGGINAGDTRDLSIDAVVPQLAAAARDPDHASLIEACRAQQRRATTDPAAPIFASPRAGMEQLVAWAEARTAATRRLRTRVERIEPGDGEDGWTVHLADGPALEADAVVVATPAFAAAPMLDEVAPDVAALLSAIDYASVAIVTFAFRPADVTHALDRSGFLVPRVEPTRALTACSWSSTKWAHLGPEHGDGTVVLRASAGRAGDQGSLDQDDDDLVAALLEDLDRTVGLTGAPTEVRVTRWPRSFPQYAPGHLDRVTAAEAVLPPTIALAGAALRGVGVPACIRSGTAAAARVLAAFRPS